MKKLPCRIAKDWDEHREKTLEQITKLRDTLNELYNIFDKDNPTLHDLHVLKDIHDSLNLPLIDHYPLIVDNPFIAECLNGDVDT